jgi:paraquat-inducible protein A
MRYTSVPPYPFNQSVNLFTAQPTSNSICVPPNLLTNPLLNKIRKQTMTPFHQFIKYLNLSLVVVFPIAWLSPLLTTDLLPPWHMPVWLGGKRLFEPDTLTVISGIQALWETDVLLALAVTFFVLVAPLLKCLGMALIHFNLMTEAVQPVITTLGKLAMAEVFILAIYIVISKGVGIGQIEVAWGLYLFTAAVLTSLGISLIDTRSS